jgi:hypothetical protein
MRLIASLAVATALATCLPSLAQAKVHILVDLDSQTMHVEAKDKTFDWKVSSGASGYDTPAGSYGVLWTDKDHKSDEYEGAPMPNAIFFKPGFAIHGAYKSNWGHPASHGCVRLPVAKSAILWDLVKAEGAEITITGGDPDAVARNVAERPQRATRAAVAGADDFYSYQEPRYRSAPPPAYLGGYQEVEPTGLY